MIPSDHPIGQHEEALSRLKHDSDDHASRIQSLEISNAARQEQIASLLLSVARIEKLITDLVGQVQAMLAKTEGDLQKSIAHLADRVEVLESADGEKWKQAVGYLLAAAIAAVVGFIVGGVG